MDRRSPHAPSFTTQTTWLLSSFPFLTGADSTPGARPLQPQGHPPVTMLGVPHPLSSMRLKAAIKVPLKLHLLWASPATLALSLAPSLLPQVTRQPPPLLHHKFLGIKGPVPHLSASHCLARCQEHKCSERSRCRNRRSNDDGYDDNDGSPCDLSNDLELFTCPLFPWICHVTPETQ